MSLKFGKPVLAHLGSMPRGRAAFLGVALAASMMSASAPALSAQTIGAPSASNGFASGFEGAASKVGREASCFDEQVKHKAADRIVTSSVYISVVDSDGVAVSSGTGSVIARSGHYGNGHNMLVTAFHVVDLASIAASRKDDLLPGQDGSLRILLTDSSGKDLGSAEVVAISKNKQRVAEFKKDVATLRLASITPTQAARFDAIEGIDLAPQQSKEALTGLIDAPVGVDHGASGGGILDNEGRLIGVMDAIIETDLDSYDGPMPDERFVHVGSIRASQDAGHVVRADFMFKNTSRAFGLSLSDPGILASLGDAAIGVRVATSPDRRASSRGIVKVQSRRPQWDVTIAAYPRGACIGYSGRMEALDASNDSQFRIPPESVASAPKEPVPYEVRYKDDGTRLEYDGDGKLESITTETGDILFSRSAVAVSNSLMKR